MKPKVAECKLMLGTAIRQMYQLQKMKQMTLAKKAGISAPYMSLIVHDRVVPSIGVMSKIAKALKINVSTLIVLAELGGRIEEMKSEKLKLILYLTTQIKKNLR